MNTEIENHERNDNGWIQTFTGKAVWPLAIRLEDFDIEDISHALSMKCRFGGFSMN